MINNTLQPIGEKDYNLILHRFKPEALTLARELRGYTKSELSELINKTSGAITQFEHGLIKPDIVTLKSLSFALGVPTNFFARNFESKPIPIENCHFRSLRSTNQKDRRQVLANAKILRNLIEILDEHVDFPIERVSELSKKLENRNEIDDYAIEVRKNWGLGLGPIPNIIQLLESKGIIVSYISHNNDDVDAFSFWENGRPYIFLLSTKGSASRTRFDCAHELGHLIMHSDNSIGDKVLESEADYFSGAFLLPRDSFIHECPNRLNWEHFYELKRRWKVSLASLVRRAYDLECISDASYKRAYVQLSKMGFRKEEPFEPEYEKPTLIKDAVNLISDELNLFDYTSILSIRSTELEAILENINSK